MRCVLPVLCVVGAYECQNKPDHFHQMVQSIVAYHEDEKPHRKLYWCLTWVECNWFLPRVAWCWCAIVLYQPVDPGVTCIMFLAAVLSYPTTGPPVHILSIVVLGGMLSYPTICLVLTLSRVLLSFVLPYPTTCPLRTLSSMVHVLLSCSELLLHCHIHQCAIYLPQVLLMCCFIHRQVLYLPQSKTCWCFYTSSSTLQVHFNIHR